MMDIETLFSSADFSKESNLKEILWNKISHLKHTSLNKLMKEEGVGAVSADKESFSKSKHISRSMDNERTGPEIAIPKLKPKKGRVL